MLNPSGIPYNEYYLYSEKAWEMVPSGISFYALEHAIQQNAPIVVTASGYETTDPSDPWTQVSGSGKYVKRGWGCFDTLSDGSYNENKDQFTLHPDSSGKIIFNKILDENVYIEYEAGASGYYILDSIDINPIRNEFESGFLHHSKITDPNSLYLMSTQGTLKADGYQTSRLVSTLYDYDFDGAPERDVVFEIDTLDGYSELGYLEPNNGYVSRTDPSGFPVEIIEETNRRGEAKVKYWTHDRKPGIQTLRASYLNINDPNYEDIRDICVLQHRLNDNYSNRDVQDGSLNGRTGLANEDTTSLADENGVINSCFSFNGTDQYVETSVNITAPKCFACWINPRSEQSSATFYHILFSKDSGHDHGLFIDYNASPNKIVVHFKDTAGTIRQATYEISTYTKWYFVIGQLESDNKVKLYVQNSLQDTSNTMLQTLEDTSSDPFRIAGGLANRYLYGRVDNCMAFERALTEDERSFLLNDDEREKLWYPGSIKDRVQIAQFYYTSNPFILDLSLLDMLDYLT